MEQNNTGIPGSGYSFRNSLQINQIPDSLALSLAFIKGSKF